MLRVKSLIILLWISMLLISSANVAICQDTINTKPAPPKQLVDSSIIKHNPKKAVLLSLLIPGGGQVFNKKIWKVPIIYAAGAALGYGLYFAQKNYHDYRSAYNAEYDGDSLTVNPYPYYSLSDLNSLKNYYHRNRDLCYIGIGVLYTLQVLDAYVDAHLFYFSVSDDISLHWNPSIDMYANRPAAPVLNLTLTF